MKSTTLCFQFLNASPDSSAFPSRLDKKFTAGVTEILLPTRRSYPAPANSPNPFLLTSLTHFAANEHDKEAAQKRGGGVPALSLEFENAESRFQLEPATDETPEKVFDRRWALTLLDRSLARLSTEMMRDDKTVLFEQLKTYLVGDLPQLSYAESASALGTSEGSIKVAVHRMRRRYRDLVRDEIMQTVSSPEEVEDELKHLWSSVTI